MARSRKALEGSRNEVGARPRPPSTRAGCSAITFSSSTLSAVGVNGLIGLFFLSRVENSKKKKKIEERKKIGEAKAGPLSPLAPLPLLSSRSFLLADRGSFLAFVPRGRLAREKSLAEKMGRGIHRPECPDGVSVWSAP